jgi:tubulin delta
MDYCNLRCTELEIQLRYFYPNVNIANCTGYSFLLSFSGIDWHIRVNSPGGLASRHNRSLSNLLVLRGKDINTADVAPFQEENLYTSWVPKDSTLAIWRHDHPFHQYEKSAALLSNSQSPVMALDGIVGKAWQMFASRAYVHQYLKHGLVEDDFMESFTRLEQVIKSYQDL